MEFLSHGKAFSGTVGFLCTVCLVLGSPIAASAPPSALTRLQAAAPRDVTFCELAANPKAFDNTRIRITAFVEFEFEHFLLTDHACTPSKDSFFQIWITFGGHEQSPAVYAPGELPLEPAEKPRFPLVVDRNFRQFKAQLDKTRDVTIRATLVGTLLAKSGGPTELTGGYGHLFCCSLFVLEKVERLDDNSRSDLDYSARGGVSAVRRCQGGSESIEYRWKPTDAVELQREADAGARSWAFNDPERVALEAMRAAHGPQVTGLVRVKNEPGRQLFEWRHDGWISEAVVIRPSFLVSVAKTRRIAWVTSWLASSSCDIEIRAQTNVRTQVMSALSRGFDSRHVDPEFTPGLLESDKERPGPSDAIYFSYRDYGVAVSLDEAGWSSWIDARPKASYPLPRDVWGRVPPRNVDYPLHRQSFESMLMLFDAIRPFGAAGPIRRSGVRRTQQYEHATVVWEDRLDPQPIPDAVQWFSVRWRGGSR